VPIKKKQLRSTNQSASILLPESAAPLPQEMNSYIEDLAAKRTGGEVNLRGIRFQLLYACERMLSLLRIDSPVTIRLEGLEDVDLHNAVVIGQAEYVQLKTSVNELTPGRLWELKVLPNFLKVYRGAPTATFTLAHTMRLATGLQQLVQHNPTALAHWGAKLRATDKSFTLEQIIDFLRRLRFEHVTEAQLYERCLQHLLTDFDVHARSEEQLLKAVFYHAFEWSRQRLTVTYRHLAEVIQAVKDSYSAAPLNEAIRHNWLERVHYTAEVTRPTTAYFAGQAARPYHIAQQLPVRRATWEARIETGLAAHAAVIIKSSSGQGKSTLAWQVGYAQQQRGVQVYELRHCANPEMANAIVEYLRAWVRVGEQPLVILDGLNAQLSAWAEVVERTVDLPVRFLLTTREEDWYRFGAAATMLAIHVVDVGLVRDEAELLYRELSQRGHLSQSATSWQPAWEAVAERQLLIEYVYLLTQGQQLRDRLAGQLRALNRELRDAKAKQEILRLVATADCLGIQLATSHLVQYVAQHIGFDADRGEVLEQLEREYFLRFGTHRVEGLHPVRSLHLTELLHQVLPLTDTLTGVCQLLAPTQMQEFFTGLSSLLPAADRRMLYTQLAPLLATRTFPEMTAALDGLLCGEALRYWQQNQAVLDEVFTAGALDLFVAETIPFAKPDLLANLGNIEGFSKSVRQLMERSRRLAPLEWDESELLLFASLLYDQQSFVSRSGTYLGLGQLGDWLHRLGLPLPKLAACGEEALLVALRTKPLAETQELFAYFWLADPVGSQAFTARHKEILLQYLRQHTDTPTLVEEGPDLVAEYLLEFSQGGQGNELSVERLRILATFLPGYAHYRSKAAIFPIRPAHLYTVALMNTEKRMTADTLLIFRAARINRQWADTILHLYRAKSLFEWQQSLLTMRQIALELAKQMVRFLEIRLEHQSRRDQAAIDILVAQSERLETLRQQRPKLPTIKGEEDASYAVSERAVEDWLASLRNFVDQFSWLIAPRDGNSRNLAIYNLTEAVQKLPTMQAAHRVISARHAYYDLADLEQSEAGWYVRLLNSARFYGHWQQLGGAKVYGAHERIRHWVETEQQAPLIALHATLSACEQVLPVQFYRPTRLLQKGSLKTAVIGVEGLDFQDESALGFLLLSLASQAEPSADYFILFPIREQQASNGLRYTKAFINWLKALVNGEETEQPMDWQMPLPTAPTTEELQVLTGITAEAVIEPIENTWILYVLQALWKLLMYRQRLVDSPALTTTWLTQIELAMKLLIDKELHRLQSILEEKKFTQLAACVTQCFAVKAEVDEDDLVGLLEQLVQPSLHR
jgi:hypothetical protein